MKNHQVCKLVGGFYTRVFQKNKDGKTIVEERCALRSDAYYDDAIQELAPLAEQMRDIRLGLFKVK